MRGGGAASAPPHSGVRGFADPSACGRTVGQEAGRWISGRGRRARLAQIRWDTPWIVLIP